MEAVDNVNDDLLRQILICLPAKSLIRFKSVSIAWFSLISDPQFCIDHTVHNFRHPTCQNHYSASEFFQQFISPYPPPIPEPILQFSLHSHCGLTPALTDNYKSLHIIHSCNGLFLCRDIQKERCVVYNFTTQNHSLLPEPPRGYDSSKGIALAFDPSKPCHYKVVRFRYLVGGHEPYRPHLSYTRAIDIFSSDTGTWKELRVASPVGSFSTDSKLIYWNGAIHWIGYQKFHVQFKVDQEKFMCNPMMLFPENCKIWYFGESNQTLVIIKFHKQSFDEVLTVLEMNRESNCWEPKYQLDLRQLNDKLPHIYESFEYRIWYVKSENEDGDLSLVLSDDRQGIIVSYSLNKFTNKDTITQIEGLKKYGYGSCFNFYPVIFSLAPV